jgi:hypothetical protein
MRMACDESVSVSLSETTINAGPQEIRLKFEYLVGFLLKQNCRKQEQDIEAISNSAYVVRHGRGELQNPKLLGFAIQLRGKYMVEIAKFAAHLREMEQNEAFLEEILDATMALLAETPELRQRLSVRISEIIAKHEAAEKKR